jgi:hypothetical protein
MTVPSAHSMKISNNALGPLVENLTHGAAVASNSDCPVEYSAYLSSSSDVVLSTTDTPVAYNSANKKFTFTMT